MDLTDTELVDLSIGIEPDAPSEPFPGSVEYHSHEDGAELLAENLHGLGIEDVDAADFPDGIGLAWEEVHAITHTGTHLDAPWHYGPESGGEPAKTIDEVPLEWCRGNAVVLDFTWKEPGSEITPDELDAQLEALDHELAPGEIVLLETGADDLWGTPEYLTEFPGMSGAATKHLVEQGVKVIGTDAYGFDKPFGEMGRRYVETGDEGELWPAHFAGRDVEYCQIEKLANLDALPRRTDVPLVTFPVVVEGASAGWVRPVAMFDETLGGEGDA
ncbi:cyclase family protein [Salinirubellus salinus]|uniref:cyclase family protein n=1 Tax=Salinirubellus salinus TaxID=1364945 RepID=UPI0034A38B34